MQHTEDNKQPRITIGISAHANAGKTTITEQLLCHAHVIEQAGRVDHGSTVTDSMTIERQRGISVRAALVSFNVGDRKIYLIDTPGHVDFSAEVERAMSVLDGAVLVISGVDGVQAHTHTIWRELRKKGIPTLIFINKMDRAGADFQRTIDDIARNLDTRVVPLVQINRRGDGQLEFVQKSPQDLLDQISRYDDEILHLYIEGKEVAAQLIREKTESLARAGHIFPVIGGSALNNIGVEELLQYIGRCFPGADDNPDKPFSAYVYSVRVDDSGRRNAYVKVLSGSIKLRDNFTVDDSTQKVREIYVSNGAELAPAEAVKSGDIAVLGGLDVSCGQLIGKNSDFTNRVSFVRPLLRMRISALNEEHNVRLMQALRILNEEDPHLNVGYNRETNSIYLSLMGEVQGQIVETMLKERFDIAVKVDSPMVIYKETPSVTASAHASYTSVSGVELEVSPLPAGSGFVYRSEYSTDFLHLKYQRQVERLVTRYAKQGMFGWELTDMEVKLIGGQFDSMGSEPAHFNIIAPVALFRCLKKARMRLLEPVCSFTVVFPENFITAVVQSLHSKQGIFRITGNQDGIAQIQGEATVSSMLYYPSELSRLTAGRGDFSSQFLRYQPCPDQQPQTNAFLGPDPRNETTFVISDMGASLEALDRDLMKKRKPSRSKFARKQAEKRLRGH